MIGKVLKRPVGGTSCDVPPRLFRQVLNPFKPVQFNRDLLAYDKEQFYEKSSVAPRSFGHCVGHFWDNTRKQAVVLDLGPVWVNCRNSYRSASSLPVSSFFEDETANILSREEGAVPYEMFLADEYRPQRSEDGAESAKSCVDKCQGEDSGSYVIPGQTPMGRNNAQKTGGQAPTDGNDQC